MEVQFTQAGDKGVALVANSSRPKFNKKSGQAAHFDEGGNFVTNSRLDNREWAQLDRTVRETQRVLMPGIEDLRSRGLVKSIGSIGVMQVDERVQSERRLADVTMRTSTRVDSDRTERKTISVPLPVIHTDYSFDERELASTRQLLLPLDVAEAREATRSVAETLEGILFNGTTDVVFNGLTIKGYNNATGALTDTAANYGGGDFATADNAYKTILGALAAAEAARFYGPFMIYMNSVQYYEMAQLRANTDTTQLQLVNGLEPIVGVRRVNTTNVAAGTVLLVQMTPDVVELQETMPISNREWMSGDRSMFYAKVMTISIPFVKTNYAAKTGIVKVTGA